MATGTMEERLSRIAGQDISLSKQKKIHGTKLLTKKVGGAEIKGTKNSPSAKDIIERLTASKPTKIAGLPKTRKPKSMKAPKPKRTTLIDYVVPTKTKKRKSQKRSSEGLILSPQIVFKKKYKIDKAGGVSPIKSPKKKRKANRISKKVGGVLQKRCDVDKKDVLELVDMTREELALEALPVWRAAYPTDVADDITRLKSLERVPRTKLINIIAGTDCPKDLKNLIKLADNRVTREDLAANIIIKLKPAEYTELMIRKLKKSQLIRILSKSGPEAQMALDEAMSVFRSIAKQQKQKRQKTTIFQQREESDGNRITKEDLASTIWLKLKPVNYTQKMIAKLKKIDLEKIYTKTGPEQQMALDEAIRKFKQNAKKQKQKREKGKPKKSIYSLLTV